MALLRACTRTVGMLEQTQDRAPICANYAGIWQVISSTDAADGHGSGRRIKPLFPSASNNATER
ncbi:MULTISPECIES: hypothetical protein [unclassified Agarivorans]|uniref:hypothetical protein n=1 Tax=unclassified Agarivorans TaxID=2636026 RepID=UPI003D7CCADB